MNTEPELKPSRPNWPWVVSVVLAWNVDHGETSDDGAYPEVVEAWDEFQIDGNRDGWVNRLKEIRETPHYGNVRVFDVTLDMDQVQQALGAEPLPVAAKSAVSDD